MTTIARFGRWWERPQKHSYLRLLENLRSKPTWPGAFVGLCSKERFLKILAGISPHRIDYPGYDFRRVDENSK
jgi:hypothetical protein